MNWLFFFFSGNRWESDIKCFCPEFHVDDKLSCFLEFLGNNYDQICFCSIHMPSYFPTTHPFSASPSHGHLFFFFFHKNNHIRKTQIQIRNIRIVKAVLSESRILYHSTSTLNEGFFLMLSSGGYIISDTGPKTIDLPFFLWNLHYSLSCPNKLWTIILLAS